MHQRQNPIFPTCKKVPYIKKYKKKKHFWLCHSCQCFADAVIPSWHLSLNKCGPLSLPWLQHWQCFLFVLELKGLQRHKRRSSFTNQNQSLNVECFVRLSQRHIWLCLSCFCVTVTMTLRYMILHVWSAGRAAASSLKLSPSLKCLLVVTCDPEAFSQQEWTFFFFLF